MIKDDDIKKLFIPIEGILDVSQPLCEYMVRLTESILSSFTQNDGFKNEADIVRKHFKNNDYDYDVVSGLILGLALSNVNIYLVMKNIIEMDNTRIIEDFIISLPISATSKAAALKNLIYSYSCDRRLYTAIAKDEEDIETLWYRKFEWIIDVLISGKRHIKYGDNKTLRLDTLKHGGEEFLESDLIARIGFSEHPLLSMFAFANCKNGGYDISDSSGYQKIIGDFILNNPRT